MAGQLRYQTHPTTRENTKSLLPTSKLTSYVPGSRTSSPGTLLLVQLECYHYHAFLDGVVHGISKCVFTVYYTTKANRVPLFLSLKE